MVKTDSPSFYKPLACFAVVKTDSRNFYSPRTRFTVFKTDSPSFCKALARFAVVKLHYVTDTIRLALSSLCLALWRCVSAPNRYQTVGTGNEELLSPEQLLPSGSHLPAVVCCWRRNSHLRPLSRYPPGVAPNCYWLLLVAGDVPPNPGPVRYPCTESGKPVRSNCDRCEM